MSDSTDMASPEPTRASDQERHNTVERLRDACVDGRITLDEFSARTEIALRATTHAELATIVNDLPLATTSDDVGASQRATRRHMIAILGSSENRGRFRIGSRVNIIAAVGSCELDLREASITESHITIRVFTLVGSAEITVPEGIDVDMGGFSLLGSRSLHVSAEPLPGSPLITIKAYSILGSVEARSRSRRSRALRELDED